MPAHESLTNAPDHFKRIFSDNAAKIAIIEHGRQLRFTFGELEDLSNRLAGLLRAHATAGGRVALLLPNGIEIVLAYLACYQLGVTAVSINSDSHANEVAHLLNFSKPDLVLTNAAVTAKIPLASGFKALRFGEGAGNDVSVSGLKSRDRLNNDRFPGVQRDLLAHIFFSSGTTGTPKAIPAIFGRICGESTMFGRLNGRGPASRFYNVLPMSYVGGWYFTMMYLMSGGSVVLDDPFGATVMYRFWGTVLEHGINSLFYSPSMVAALAAMGPEDDEQAARIKTQIQWALVGLAPLTVDLKQKYESVYGVRLIKMYAITETLICASWMSHRDLPDATVGRLLPAVDVAICANDGSKLPAGEDGEIRIKSEWMFDGYWNQPELTAAALDERGYFKTGDIGRFDKDGNLFITGRIKDLIIRGGFNIAPVEIENVIHGLKGIRDAAVIGVDDELYGEKVIAAVTLTPNAALTPDDVMAWCRKHLSAAKMPTTVCIVPEFPVNSSSGKVDKRALKKLLIDKFGV